jgi:hypothetical protein
LHEFSDTAIQHHPLSKPADEGWAENLSDSVETVAKQLKIAVKVLQTSQASEDTGRSLR